MRGARALRALRSLLAVAALPLAMAVLAGGCNSYRYFDVHLTLGNGFDVTKAFKINNMVITVSGADSGRQTLPTGKCPNRATAIGTNPLDCGIFEFSTFADSGNLTFIATGYEGQLQNDTTKCGDGTVSISVTDQVSTMGDLAVVWSGPGCAAAP